RRKAWIVSGKSRPSRHEDKPCSVTPQARSRTSAGRSEYASPATQRERRRLMLAVDMRSPCDVNDFGAYYERHRRHIGAASQPACTDAVVSTKWIGGGLTRPFGTFRRNVQVTRDSGHGRSASGIRLICSGRPKAAAPQKRRKFWERRRGSARSRT